MAISGRLWRLTICGEHLILRRPSTPLSHDKLLGTIENDLARGRDWPPSVGLARKRASTSINIPLLSSTNSITTTLLLGHQLKSGLGANQRWQRCYSSSSSSSSSRYNHYETLGIAQDATPQEIKKAFYSLSKRCHPDLHPDDERMAEKFKSLTVAYETLIDKDKRRDYDMENNFRSSTPHQRWHGYSSAKYYPVAKGQRPQVSYTRSDPSRRREKRRSEGGFSDFYAGASGDSNDEWIKEQRRKMKERLEEEDRQFKQEWKEMMGSSATTTPGTWPGDEDHPPLSPEEEKKWKEFQRQMEMRRVEREKQMAFQNQRIEKHPHLVYFYTMNWNAILTAVWIFLAVGGFSYVCYVFQTKDPEEMPHRSMKRQFEEEGRLHKQKMAEKKERQKQLEALFLQRELEKMKLRKEEEEERRRKEAEAAMDDEEEDEEDEDEEDEEGTVEESKENERLETAMVVVVKNPPPSPTVAPTPG